MGISKNKEELNESGTNYISNQVSQEEGYKLLLRENKNTSEKHGRNGARKTGWKNSTKVEKISTVISVSGIASILSSTLFAATATATGALSSAAIITYSGALIAVGVAGMVIGSVGLYGSFIAGKLSKRKGSNERA